MLQSQSTEEGISKTNTHPYILAIRSLQNVKSMVIVSDKKVVTSNICVENGHIFKHSLHCLLSTMHTPWHSIQLWKVVEFLQEKFLLSVVYQNLFCSVTCFETKLQAEMDKSGSTSDDDDDDATQADFIFLDWMWLIFTSTTWFVNI